MDLQTTDHAVGRELRSRRARRDVSRAELALTSGVSLSTIRRIERAERSATVEQLSQLTEALGVDVADFVRDALARASE